MDKTSKRATAQTQFIQHAQIIDSTPALEQPTPDTLTPEQALRESTVIRGVCVHQLRCR